MAINKNALQAKLQSDRENRAHIPEQNTESKMKQVLSATSTVPQPKQKKKRDAVVRRAVCINQTSLNWVGGILHPSARKCKSQFSPVLFVQPQQGCLCRLP